MLEALDFLFEFSFPSPELNSKEHEQQNEISGVQIPAFLATGCMAVFFDVSVYQSPHL